MQANETQILKEALDTFQKQGLAITAEWNAGGDECICEVKIGDKEDIMYQNLSICDYLTELVIQRLQLPEVGEVFHHGNGVIKLDDKGRVVIQFNAKYGHYYGEGYYYDNETGHYQEIEETLATIQRREFVKDPLNLRNVLHRADIHLVGRINRNQEVESSIEIKVWQGDKFIFTQEEQKPYLEWIEKILFESLIEMEKQETSLKKGKEYTLFHSANVRGKLTKETEVLFEVSPSHEHFENYIEKKVLLINLSK